MEPLRCPYTQLGYAVVCFGWQQGPWRATKGVIHMKDPVKDTATQPKDKWATPKTDEFGKPITKPAETLGAPTTAVPKDTTATARETVGANVTKAPADTLGTPKMTQEPSAPETPCPGSKIRSDGQGKGLGHGHGQGPVGRPKL